MTKLIAQQRVLRRKKAKAKQLKETKPPGSPQFKHDSKRDSLLATPAVKRIFARFPSIPGPKYLYIIGGLAAIVCIVLFSSSAIGRNTHGIGGGLGALPRDFGIDSLLERYLSPGKSPDDDAGEIVPTGKVFMSYDPVTYTVERGDTVSGIAYKFNLDMSTIISFNGIGNVRRLQAGVELKIPPVDGVMHLVKGRESLSSIASSYGVNLEPILDINNLDSEVIHEGDKLFVPNAEMSYVTYHKAMGDLFIYPVRGTLSSGFGMRKDPFTGLWNMHRGYDIVGAIGTSVKASNEGRVIYTGENTLYGKYVLLSHQGGFQTLYAHLSKWVVSEGQTVVQKQKIAEVGNTGRSTGPHLHFSIYYNGDALDPGRYLYF
jgi:murein DD-endopeptidase MepM/ murein hydrolase activator NlpD